MVKIKRFLSILATAVILAMLITVIPVAPALAAEHLSVTPTSGEIDDYVEVIGSGFDPAIDDYVYLYFSSDDADVGDEIDDEVTSYELVAEGYLEGSTAFDSDFDVPDRLRDGDDDEDVVSGDYYVYATYQDDDEIVAKDDFRVIVISVSLSPDQGTVGTEVRVSGSGFEDREDVEIEFGGSSVDISRGDDQTSSSGAFTSYFIVPESTAGDHTVTVTVHNDEAEADFEVEPDITIEPDEGAANERVTVTGTGFAYREDITITIDGEDVGGDETDSSGSFEAQINVPELGAGSFDVDAEDESNNSASATFKIITEVSVSPTTSVNSPGHVGQELTISGSGFKPDYEMEIVYESTPVVVANPISEADGSFSATFEVPPSEHGEHTITASDGTSAMSVDFYMESTPPDTPPPLLPYMDGKADSQAHFEWEAVTADIDGIVEQSLPITYELQIATDPEFTDLLLDKKGIETTEYTLTEDEALEKTSDEIPYYYWRLRAVDAASNASPWTGSGQFKVGFSFGFPSLSGWLLYLLIGIGALVLFFVGFWIGRRGGGGEYY
jgi:hypothetical protein